MSNIFDKKAPHEKYAEKVENKYQNTPEGRQWLAASKLALQEAHTIELPYRHHGYFQPDTPRALGLAFNAKQGERLFFAVNKKAGGLFVLYADIFKEGSYETPLVSADTSAAQFSFDVEESGNYVLRLQPELFRTGSYEFSVSVGPSLAFPVPAAKARIGSFWGDERDGGQRSHEGVDIFAAKRSPVVASADGYVTGVGDGGIGGKTVWLRVKEKNYTLYYAHLDLQLVSEGQWVQKGDTIGLVGNTGNARTTPPHLHFGIYSYGGPVDPLPYISQNVKTAPAVTARDLTGYLELIKSYKGADGSIAPRNTVLVPLAVTSKGYLAELPGGKIIETTFTSVKPAPKAEKFASSAKQKIKGS